MRYYFVAIATAKYHGKDLLTYSSRTILDPGTLVIVPLQNTHVYGFIVEETTKPSFETKELAILDRELPPIPPKNLELFKWMREYYPAPLGILAQLFLPAKFPKTIKKPKNALENSPVAPVKLPPLTSDQRKALQAISSSGSFLIHGETGSGKTRLYIELAKQSLQQNRSCIILTPEISLTSQLFHAFEQSFDKSRLIILHSQLTDATRRDLWLKILTATMPLIVIGPRSALFSPLSSIGLIVVDESHEVTYKQENTPHYHATRVASKFGQIHNARVILGSATPSVTDYFLATARKRPILKLKAINGTARQPKTKIIDMRDKTQLSRSPHLSVALLTAMEQTLANKQQVLLFINRRGTARIVLCENCGWQAACPHCDLPLTYHHDTHTLQCHTCGFTQAMMSSCPECNHADIILRSIGTKSIVAEVSKLFPSARVERFDTDNKKGERIHEIYDEIRTGKIDILVGTQMLAKGLDLPKLGLVGVINADASMYVPDFTAQERTYQLLYQVIGRIGRSSQATDTQAIIQTYNPDNPTIQAAAKRDWETFYSAELQERKTFLFPPFCYLLKATIKRAKAETAQTNAERLAQALRKSTLHITIDGPAPAFHEKIQNKYVWQLIIKSKARGELLKVIDHLPNDWSYDIDPVNLL